MAAGYWKRKIFGARNVDLEERSSIYVVRSGESFSDLDDAELHAVLSPRSKLNLLTDAATQRQETAVGADDLVRTVFDRAIEEGLIAGSSVTGCQSGTVDADSNVSFGGSLGLADESRQSDSAAGHDTFWAVVRRSDNIQENAFSGRDVERSILSSGRQSLRWDRESGCRSDGVGPSTEECADREASS